MTAPKSEVRVYSVEQAHFNFDDHTHVVLYSDHDQEIQALKADLERLVKMYSPKLKRNCQHDDPSWCNQFCNDYGHLAREIGEKWKIKYE